MRVVGDLGFPSLAILTACLAFPLILLFVRYKWRQDVARNEEIKRLLVLASEEESWAEVEAKNGAAAYYGVASGFGSGSVLGSGLSSISGSGSGSSSYQVCAVCFSPTTTRCAQCKAVRYCSGKCQIIHWRRGHKYECHPASNPCRDTDEGSGYSQKITDQENEVHGQEYGTEGKVHLKPAGILPEESVSSRTTSFADASCSRDDISKVGSSIDNEGGSPTSDSSSLAFSGSSCCTSSGELSNDASTSDSATSTDTKRSDEHGFATGPCQLPKIATRVDYMSESSPPSPKFASLANSLHMSSDLSKLKHNKSGCDGGGSPCELIKSSSLNSDDTEKSLTSQPIGVSSAFWERALGSIDTGHDTQNRSTLLSSDGILSDTKTSHHFPFDFSRSAVTPCSEGPKPKRSLSGDSDLASIESESSTSSCINAEEVIQDSSLTYNMSNYTKKCSSMGMPVVDSRELKSSTSASSSKSVSSDIRQDSDIAKDFNGGRLSSSGLKKTGGVDNSVSITSGVAKPVEAECTMSTFDIKEDSVKVKYISTSKLPSLGSRRASDAVTSNIPRPGETDCRMSTSMGSCTSSVRPAPVTDEKASRVDCIQATSAMSSEVASYSTNAKNGLRTSVMKVVDQFRGTKLPRHNPDGTQSDVAGKYDNKGLFPYDTFVKLYNWNKVILQPCGLLNCGNSCYANAVLQCLAFTPPLTAYLLQGLHSKACLKKDRCFTCEFEKLVLMAKEGISPLSPGRLLSQLQNNGCHLGNGREEDAHEFLRHAIETMQSVCLVEAGVSASASVEEETTLIGQTFGGYLRSKIKCLKCRGKSERQERMMDLTVEIDGDIGTLEEALRQFTGTELLDGENKYHCSRCKSYEKAKKKLTVLEAPNVLTVALKRFQSGKFGKLNKPIRFPEILNLAPYMSGTSDKLPIYRIYAVIVHLDIMNAAFSGHYVCYVKNSQNKWFKTDDSTVVPVEFEKVLSKGAYMLQYARCSPRAPRLVRNRVISSEQKNMAIPQKRCGKHMSLKSRAASAHSGASRCKVNVPSSYRYRPGSRDHYAGLSQGILEEDLSDNSSLISSNSDECSCSTDSTRDSTSTDDFSDYLFGDTVHGWSSPWRNPSDIDSLSPTSSSPLFSKNSSLVDLDRYASGFHETNGGRDSVLPFDHDHVWDREPKSQWA